MKCILDDKMEGKIQNGQDTAWQNAQYWQIRERSVNPGFRTTS